MKNNLQISVTLLLATFLLGLPIVCPAGRVVTVKTFNIRLEPVGQLEAGATNTMRIEYSLKPQFEDMGSDSGRYTVKLFNPRDFKKALSDTTYTVNYDYNYSSTYCYSYSGIFELVLPKTDSLSLEIEMQCGSIMQSDRYYFIQSKDSVILVPGFIPTPDTPLQRFYEEETFLASQNFWKIKDKESAIEVAIRYTGFDKADSGNALRSCKVKAKLNVITDDKTPFMHRLINGKIVWEVVFSDYELFDGRGNEHRDFEVLISPVTGRLLRIYSISDHLGDSDTLSLPDPQSVEDNCYKSDSANRFLGISDYEETLTFYDAIRLIPFGPPRESKVIRAVLYEKLYRGDTLLTWSIALRGMPSPLKGSIPRFPGSKPVVRTVYEHNLAECYIDAKRGILLGCGNSPLLNVEEILRRKEIKR